MKREQVGSSVVLRLSGEINELVDFEKSFGATAPDTVLHCKDVTRINSIGIKSWVKFFQERVAAGTHLRFIECSPALVEQLNLIMNFACGGKVESIYVPFACNACKKSMVELFEVASLKAAKFELPLVKCVHCGQPAFFDDLPEEYFRFATR